MRKNTDSATEIRGSSSATKMTKTAASVLSVASVFSFNGILLEILRASYNPCLDNSIISHTMAKNTSRLRILVTGALRLPSRAPCLGLMLTVP